MLGIRALIGLGLAGLLSLAGLIAALVATRPLGGELESRIRAQHLFRTRSLAKWWEARCPQGCEAKLLERELRGDLQSLSIYEGPRLRLGPALGRDLVVDVLQSHSSAEEHRRREHLVAWPLRLGSGWGVLLASYDLSDLQAALQRRQQILRYYLLADFLGVLLFGIYLSGRIIVDPIRRLTQASSDPQGKIPLIERPLELAQLSRTFAELVEHLRTQNGSLSASLKQLEQARDRLVRSEKLATVGHLAAGIAHEVGNPLAAVIGYLDYLRDERGCPPELQGELLARMDKELERIRCTIRQLLDYSRPSPRTLEWVEVSEVIASALELLRYHKKLRGLKYRVEGEAPLVWISAEHLRQVLINLLLNAGEAQEGRGEILIRISESEGSVQIQVEDQGPGISPEHIERIFEPFFSTKGAGQGTGLGLAICQRLIEELGGNLSLEKSAETAGACFLISLSKEDDSGSTTS